MELEKELERLREEETERILKLLEGMTEEEKKFYIRGFSEALSYSESFQNLRDNWMGTHIFSIMRFLP